jgi:hypothetical protein
MRARFWLETVKERDHSEDQGVDGRITLKWTLSKTGRGVWTGVIWFSMRTGGGLLSTRKHDKPSGFIKGEECLD